MAYLEQLHQASDITRLDRAALDVARGLRDSPFDINTIMLGDVSQGGKGV